MTTMWLILPSCVSPRSDSDPAAGRTVSASNEASATGTMIRRRELIKLPPPFGEPRSVFLGSLFTRRKGRNQEDTVKASPLPNRCSLPVSGGTQYQAGGEVADKSTPSVTCTGIGAGMVVGATTDEAAAGDEVEG